MGIVRDKWGAKNYQIPNIKSDLKLIDVLKKCAEELNEKFWEFFDSDYSPKRGIIIIVDGVDYKVKGGLTLQVELKTEITIISAIHGG